MTPALARSAFAIAFHRCLRLAAWPALSAAVAAWFAARWFAPALPQPDAATSAAAGAMTPWLGLPMICVAAVVTGTAIMLWPTFTVRHANDDRGTDWITRLQRGPLRGSGAVMCGALAAQLVLTLPMSTWLARELGAPTTAVARHALEPPTTAWLDPEHTALRYELAGSRTINAIELRPMAAMPGGPLLASRLVVRGDGEILSEIPIDFHQSGQQARTVFAERRLRQLSIELTAGNVPLYFPSGAVVVVESGSKSGFLNGCLLALVYLLPTFLALAFACLCGSVAAAPTVLTVAMVLLFLSTTAGVGPSSNALLALLRGHWLPGSGIFTASAPSLAAGFAAMIAAMLLRWRHRA